MAVEVVAVASRITKCSTAVLTDVMFLGDVEHLKRMVSLKYEVGDALLCLMAERIQLAHMTCFPRNGTDHRLRDHIFFKQTWLNCCC